GFLPALREDAVHSLLIEDARVGFARLEIGLITADDEVPAILAAILDAGIAEALVAVGNNLVGDAQLEVADHLVRAVRAPDEEVVALGRIFLRSHAGDSAILHRPVVGAALPTGKILAVEDGNEAGLICRGGGQDDASERTER